MNDGTFQSWPCRYCGERLVLRPDRKMGDPAAFTHFGGGSMADMVCAGDHVGREPLPDYLSEDDAWRDGEALITAYEILEGSNEPVV